MKGRMDRKCCGNTELHTCWGQVCPVTGSPGTDGSCPARSQRAEGPREKNASLTCGALPAKVSSKTPARKEEHCSAGVATVTVVGGAEWINGAVMSKDNYADGFIFLC